jgi:hypothetical protein
MKKVGAFILLVLSIFVLGACNGKTDNNGNGGNQDPPEQTDTRPPVFTDAVGGKLLNIEHLQGDDYDFLAGINVIDDKTEAKDIVVEVDLEGYDKNIPGTYEITYTAKDEAGNSSNVTRTVIVIETLEVTLPAIVIGEDINFNQIEYNNEDAFLSTSAGANFRNFPDLIQVMEKDFYLDQLTEHSDAWGPYPAFAWGTVLIITEEGAVKHARFTAGVQMEIDETGEVTYDRDELVWFADHGGGDLFKGIDEEFLDELISDGGYVVFGPSEGKARIFLNKNIFWSEYAGGGGMYKDAQDVDVTTLVVQINQEHHVKIAKPVPVATPEIIVQRHVLKWDPVENASGYDIYVDGEKINETLFVGTTFDLLDVLRVRPVIYELEVVARSVDIYRWSDSAKSNLIEYLRPHIRIQSPAEISYDDGLVSWEASEGAIFYEIYLRFAGKRIMVGTTETTSFDPQEVSEGYEGTNFYFIKGVGSETYSDSDYSNELAITVDFELETLEIGAMSTEVALITAENYFVRRNTTDQTKLPGLLYKVTGVTEYLAAGNIALESYSLIVVLDSDDKLKLIRSILSKHSYSPEKGWYTDDDYPNYADQLSKIGNYIVEGDTILIGKNGLDINYQVEGQTIETAAREFLAYHFVNSWDDFPTVAVAPDGWRGDLNDFIEAKEVEFNFS